MPKKNSRIVTVDGMARSRDRDFRLGKDPFHITLAEWVDNWALAGGIASTEVIGELLDDETIQYVAILGIRLPLSYEDFLQIIADSVIGLGRLGFLTDCPRPLPAKSTPAAPKSNTGLSVDGFPLSTGAGGVSAETNGGSNPSKSNH